jgi:hypothetical protein
MKRETKNLCLISVISFIVGAAAVPLVVMALGAAVGFLGFFSANRQSQKQQAEVSFYRTMNALFENKYDPNDGLVSPEALKTIQECKHQLGYKCELFFVDTSDTYHECIAFFPSGDYFYVSLSRIGKKKWIIQTFYQLDWDRQWNETLYRIGER